MIKSDMTVADLTNTLEESPGVYSTVPITEIEISEDGIEHERFGTTLNFDDGARHKLSKFLQINAKYIEDCPPELARHNLNYWLQNSASTGYVTVQTAGDQLLTVTSPDVQGIPITSYLDVITKVFAPTDVVKNVSIETERLEIDILTPQQVEVPGDGSERRPRVGDITMGGLRLVAFPDQKKPPVVSTYMHRLVCSNGLTVTDAASKISLRGKGIDDILAELQAVSRGLIEDMHIRLENYANTANMPVDGDLTQFMLNVGFEHNLGKRILRRVMDLGSELPRDGSSVYDVLNVFTEVGKEVTSLNARTTLESLGGTLASSREGEGILHRCSQCERSFAEVGDIS